MWKSDKKIRIKSSKSEEMREYSLHILSVYTKIN